jgi:hypothetical protein
MSGSINAEERRLAQQRQQDCLNGAIFAGCKASATALLVSGGLCSGLLKYSEVGAAAGCELLCIVHIIQLGSSGQLWRCCQHTYLSGTNSACRMAVAECCTKPAT